MSTCRIFWYRLLGMHVGKSTILSKVHITWPHQVSIGSKCFFERNSYLKFDGIWRPEASICIGNNVFIGYGCEFNISKKIEIGNDCLIASGCKFIDHDHGTSTNELMRVQVGLEAPIIIGENVWLGCNVIVLKGIQIGDGAIVAAGAVVTKTIYPNEIWAGVPAKKIGERK